MVIKVTQIASIHHPKWYWYNAIDGKVKGIIWCTPEEAMRYTMEFKQ